MLPLALICKSRGDTVTGSDRSYDQGRTPEKFAWLKATGIGLSAQDGSGISKNIDALVVSTAVEASIPDVKAALELGIKIIKRSELLANLFNQADQRIAIAGTSGKSTTTGMIGYVQYHAEKNPTVMNGAVFRDFQTPDTPYATALYGDRHLFVTEADESDGSIALYNPTIAVLNNISLDHKGIDELRSLFTDFVQKAGAAVLNLDNGFVAEIAQKNTSATNMTYGLIYPNARLGAADINTLPDGLTCLIEDRQTGKTSHLRLKLPGLHNLANALACIGVCLLLGLELQQICNLLSGFSGVKRRLEVIGQANGITVIDDFAHNPDKIDATLKTLKEFPGRLHIMFQIHGYNPIKLMHKEFTATFAKHLTAEDTLYIPEVLYLGGTVDKGYTAKDLVEELKQAGINAIWHDKRDEIADKITSTAQTGDRVVVMGARDDTLSNFAKEILNRLS